LETVRRDLCPCEGEPERMRFASRADSHSFTARGAAQSCSGAVDAIDNIRLGVQRLTLLV